MQQIKGDNDLPHIKVIWQDLSSEEWIFEASHKGTRRGLYATPHAFYTVMPDGSIDRELDEWPEDVSDPALAAQIIAHRHW